MCLVGEARAKKGNSGWRLAVGGWPTRCRAKVQIGAMLLCKGAKVSDSFQVAGRCQARDLILSLKTRTGVPMAETWDPRMRSRQLPPVAATCHPGMEALGQHAVLPLPRFSYVVTRSRPYLLHRKSGQPANWSTDQLGSTPCPRVTVPTCPLRKLSLRLCFRFRDQREDADRHDDESDIADPLGQAEEFGEAEFAVGADG